jgi:hypothetical protein
MARKTLADRFWSKVNRRSPDECWPWTASRDLYGYGRIWVGGGSETTLKAHRVAWELAAGEPVPTGLWVLHTCDNPGCVNPAHLWLGTHDDNMRDMNDKGRLRGACQSGEKNWSAKLNPEAVKVIRFMRGRASCCLLARLHGIGKNTVSRAWRGEAWRSARIAGRPLAEAA